MAEGRKPWDAPTVEEVLGPIVAACPSFRAVWADVAGRAGSWDASGYLVMLELAEHLTALRQRGETDEIAPTFATIEEMLAGADSGLDELLTLHFVADLQTDAKQTGHWTFVDEFIPFLGARMRVAWRSGFHDWKSGQGLPPTL
jgi:hypothetical protein